jgi:hypothetical protein
MAGILKGIAMGVGIGVALGVCATAKGRRSLPRSAQPDDYILHLEPLLDRFDRAEGRLEALENQPAADALESAAMMDFNRRLGEQESALRELRADVDETDRRLAAQAEIAGNRFAQIRKEIPLAVEASLSVRMSNLEASLRAELDAKYQQSLENLEKVIDQKISDRISALERTLAEQSASIAVLRLGAETADANLHRLIGAVERLCERASAQADQPPAPPVRAGSGPESFHARLTQAMRTSGLADSAADSRPRLVKEAAPEERKPRIPVARIFVALAAFGVARFLR